MVRHVRERDGLRARQRGVALVFVLWAGLLISAIALGITLTAKTQLAISVGVVDRLRAEALADAGIRAGIVKMLDRGEGGSGWFPRTFELELAGGAVSVSVVSEHGRVDLNAAAEPLVRALADVVTDGNGDALAEAWLARRGDEDVPPTESAAEDELQPATGAFMVKRELFDLPGVDSAVYSRLQAAATVHSRQSGIDPLSAPRDVLLALPGATPEMVDAIIAERQALSAGAQRSDVAGMLASLRAQLPAAVRLLVTRRPSVFTVTAVARLPGGAEAVREAVVSTRRTPEHPYSILEWGDESWYSRGATSSESEALGAS